eukprot:scaffold2092_cov144-Amphora_coffeaeformis.AAC.8
MCEQTPPMRLKSVRKKPRRRKDAAAPFLFLVLVQRWAFVAADGSASNNNDNNNGQQQDPSQSYSKGLLTVEKYCRRKSVVVTSARLTCDSPGAYYYGSETYRGSEVCIGGDKAHLKLRCKQKLSDRRIVESAWSRLLLSHPLLSSVLPAHFLVCSVTIADDFDPTTSIYVQVEAGLYQNYKRVIAPSRLCQMQIQAANGYGQKCPYPGEYVFESYFYLPKMLEDNSDFHFTPDINMTFTDGDMNRLGCAVTGTAAFHRQASRRHSLGMTALGFGLLVFGVVFGGLLILAYRRRKRLESLTERKVPRYQYFRTLPNGQVVPLQPGQAPGPPPPHPHAPPPPQVPYHMPPGMHPGTPHEAYQISNPAYNETQLPTRPVI